MTRAAKTLHESLDLETLLTRICREALAILDADLAVVYRGTPDEGLHVAATAGAPPEMVGIAARAGHRARRQGAPDRQADAHQRLPEHRRRCPPARRSSATTPRSRSRSSGASELRGILSVGYARPHHVTQDDLALLETFAELAAAACRNASLHAAIAQEARTDGLTGCLNHAALHESLLREIERAARVAGRDLSLILLDLNDFKQVNEEHGHLVGDEVLRRIGSALRGGTRPYDIAARYGGDEFALLAIEADEEQAGEIAAPHDRAHRRRGGRVRRGQRGRRDRRRRRVGAGPDRDAADRPRRPRAAARQAAGRPRRGEPLLRAPRARVHPPLRVPLRPRAGRRAGCLLPGPTAATRPASACASARASSPLANALGTRLSAMTDVQEILDAVVEELHRAFGYYCCAAVRLRADGHVESAAGRGDLFLALASREWSQPREVGLIGRCLREGRPVVVGDVTPSPTSARRPRPWRCAPSSSSRCMWPASCGAC